MEDKNLDSLFRGKLGDHERENDHLASWLALQSKWGEAFVPAYYSIRRWLRIAIVGLGIMFLVNGILWYYLISGGIRQDVSHQPLTEQSTIEKGTVRDTIYVYLTDTSSRKLQNQMIPFEKKTISHHATHTNPHHPTKSTTPILAQQTNKSKLSTHTKNDAQPSASKSPKTLVEKSLIETTISEKRKEAATATPPSNKIQPTEKKPAAVSTRLKDGAEVKGKVAIVESKENESISKDKAPIISETKEEKNKKTKSVNWPEAFIRGQASVLLWESIGSELRPTPQGSLLYGLKLTSRWRLMAGLGYEYRAYERKELGTVDQAELGRYPELLELGDAENLQELYMRSDILQIPVLLQYNLFEAGKWNPFVQAGWTGIYGIRQNFEYEFISNGAETKFESGPFRPGWTFGTMLLGGGVQYALGDSWELSSGLRYAHDWGAYGLEKLRSSRLRLELTASYSLGKK